MAQADKADKIPYFGEEEDVFNTWTDDILPKKRDYYEIFKNSPAIDLTSTHKYMDIFMDILSYVFIYLIKLKTIIMSGRCLNSYDITTLSKGLYENDTIEWLDFSHNVIDNYGFINLGILANTMPNLKHLDISHNRIYNTVSCESLNEYPVTTFAKSLAFNKTLDYVNLSGIDLGTDVSGSGENGADQLSSALFSNTTLMELIISQCHICIYGSYCMADAILNSELRILDISNNNITNDGAIYFAKMLAKNTLLTNLDLSNCKIGDVGIKALAEALKNNTNSGLMTLNLSGNNFGIEGLNALKKMLETNTTLRKIIITNITNNSDQKEIEEIEEINEKLAEINAKLADEFRKAKFGLYV